MIYSQKNLLGHLCLEKSALLIITSKNVVTKQPVIDFNKKVRQTNLTTAESLALKSLKSRDDTVRKPADKGGCVVVWRKDLYQEEGYSQLNDNDAFYQQQRKDPTNKFNETIIQVIDNEIEKNNLPSNASKLTINHPRTSLFYMLPKVHKANNPGRPIVSAVSCLSSHIASFLDFILTPIVKHNLVPRAFCHIGTETKRPWHRLVT